MYSTIHVQSWIHLNNTNQHIIASITIGIVITTPPGTQTTLSSQLNINMIYTTRYPNHIIIPIEYQYHIYYQVPNPRTLLSQLNINIISITRYPIHIGLHKGIIAPLDPHGLPTDVETLADILLHAGYSTHAVGRDFLMLSMRWDEICQGSGILVSARANTCPPTGAFNTTMATGWELRLKLIFGQIIWRRSKRLASSWYRTTTSTQGRHTTTRATISGRRLSQTNSFWCPR